MKRVMLFGVFVTLSSIMLAQGGKETVSPYFRNAMTQMMVYHPEDEFGYELFEIFKNLPPMEKFDKHDVKLTVFDNSEVTCVEEKAKGFHRQTYGGSMVLSDKEKNQNAMAMLKMLNQAQVGKRMVATWFDLQGDKMAEARFSTKTLEKRTGYNVSVQDAVKTQYTLEGTHAVKAVAEDLMGHTFLLVTDITYIMAEQRAQATKMAFMIIGLIIDIITQSDSGSRMAESVGQLADMFTGFKVMTHNYLFQLEWNDAVSNTFYEKYYCETPDPMKVLAFLEDTTSFRLKYVGYESTAYEKTKTKGKYTRRSLLEMITRQSVDNNIAKLQSTYEQFRIKTQISGIEVRDDGSTAYRAMVGLKEGVRDDRDYEVLEARINNKGKLEYNRVAVVKPIMNEIWDNRFNALIEGDVDIVSKGTLFKLSGAASKEIVPGMIVREL